MIGNVLLGTFRSRAGELGEDGDLGEVLPWLRGAASWSQMLWEPAYLGRDSLGSRWLDDTQTTNATPNPSPEGWSSNESDRTNVSTGPLSLLLGF